MLATAAGSIDGQPGARSRPAEHATATCQAVTGPTTPNEPNRPVTAAVAAPSAASRSRHGEPSAFGTGWSTPDRRAICSRCSRVASNRGAITRSHPRTVAAGTINFFPIDRCPAPPARASNAAPITPTAYARRNNTATGNNTCVTEQFEQRARRGRSTGTRP